MTKGKCSFTDQVITLVNGKTRGKHDTALFEHAASCPVCGPVLAAAMKTLDDERQGRLTQVSPILQANVMESALQELNKGIPAKSREARPWFFKVAYYAAAACVLLLGILFFTPKTNPWDKPSPLDPGMRKILIGLKGGADNDFKNDFGKYCYELGDIVERLYYFRDFGGNPDPKINKSYRNLIASIKAVFGDETSSMALGLNKLPDSLGKEDPVAFEVKVENFKTSVEAICRASGINDWNWFFTLGRTEGALVNYGYAPTAAETYVFPNIIEMTPPDDIPDQMKVVLEKLQPFSGKRMSRDMAKRLYKELSDVERDYVK